MAISEQIRLKMGDILQIGGDVVVVAIFTLLTAVIQTSLVAVPEPIRALSSIPMILFLPGYAFVSALYPYAGPIVSNSGSRFFARFEVDSSNEATGLVRAIFSLVSSVMIVSLLGVVLGHSPIRFSTASIVVGLGLVTIVCSVAAIVRRQSIPYNERYSPEITATLITAISGFREGKRSDVLLRSIVILSLLLSVGSISYVIAVPQQGETPTEFYLLGANETEEPTAEGYPDTVSSDDTVALTAGIRSHEPESTEFKLLITLDRVETDGNSSVLLERSEMARYRTTLAAGERWEQKYAVTPPIQGENLRLTHLLYRGDIPEEPTTDNAYRTAYVWITVTEPAANSSSVSLDSPSMTIRPIYILSDTTPPSARYRTLP